MLPSLRALALTAAVLILLPAGATAEHMPSAPDQAPDAVDVSTYGDLTRQGEASADVRAPVVHGDRAAEGSLGASYDRATTDARVGAHGSSPTADTDTVGAYAVHRSGGALVVYGETNGCPGLQQRDEAGCDGEDRRLIAQSTPGVGVPDPSTPNPPGTPSPPGTPAVPNPSVPSPPSVPDPWTPSPPDVGDTPDAEGLLDTVVSTLVGLIPSLGDDPGTPDDPVPDDQVPSAPTPPDPGETPNPSPPNAPDLGDTPGPDETPNPGNPIPDMPGVDDVIDAINDVLSEVVPPL